MPTARTILFLCPHAAASSVLAAAYCAGRAAALGLDIRVDFAGTHPDAALSPAVAEALRLDGLNVAQYRPRRVTAADIAGAWRIISLGCDPDALPAGARSLERWDDIPPPSGDLDAARSRIAGHVDRLLAALVETDDEAAAGWSGRP